jgi:uncharacterized membrane protein YuzA (DUF378 family)
MNENEEIARWVRRTATAIVAVIGALALGVIGLMCWGVFELVTWVVSK